MSKFSPSGISGVANSPTPISISGATTFTVTNVTCTLANTEYSFALPASTKKLKLRARGMSRIQIADTTGLTDTTYFTVWPGECYEDDALTSAVTIYFEASKAAEVVEIITWT